MSDTERLVGLPQPAPLESGELTYVDYSAVRQIVGGVVEFVRSPRQWMLARRVGSSSLLETVTPDGITEVASPSDLQELTYIDYSVVRSLTRFGKNRNT